MCASGGNSGGEIGDVVAWSFRRSTGVRCVLAAFLYLCKVFRAIESERGSRSGRTMDGR